MSDLDAESDYIQLAADIVSAFVSNNSVPTGELPGLISSVHNALQKVATGTTEQPKQDPPVPIKKSVTPDFIISLEDGKRYKSLKRHLRGRGLTPEQYRQKWGLPHDYPMVAPNYAKQRSDLAKSLGLGQIRNRRGQTNDAVAEGSPPAARPRGRPKKAG
jgi:predicted transcriptional regulator